GRWDLAPPMLVERLDHAVSRPVHDLVLGNRREMHHTNSTLAWATDEPCIYVNPADALTAGVSDGDSVEVSSPYGTVVATARLDDGLRGAQSPSRTASPPPTSATSRPSTTRSTPLPGCRRSS